MLSVFRFQRLFPQPSQTVHLSGCAPYDVKWRDTQPRVVCKFHANSASFNFHALYNRVKQRRSRMVLGAGSLRFFGVLWIVLLHQRIVSGRDIYLPLFPVRLGQFHSEIGSKFSVKRKT